MLPELEVQPFIKPWRLDTTMHARCSKGAWKLGAAFESVTDTVFKRDQMIDTGLDPRLVLSFLFFLAATPVTPLYLLHGFL